MGKSWSWRTGPGVGEPFHHVLALLAVAAAGLAFVAGVDGLGAGGGAEPGVVVAVLVVGKHYLRAQCLVALAVLGKQGQQVELDGAVPVEQLGVGMVFFKLHQLHGVVAHHLALEIVVTVGVVGVHDGRGGVGLDGVAEHVPVGVGGKALPVALR